MMNSDRICMCTALIYTQLLAAEADVSTGLVPPIVLDRKGLLACSPREVSHPGSLHESAVLLVVTCGCPTM